jgi:hypothetical protein
MARSRKNKSRRKMQRKVKLSRKQRGGEANDLTWPLDEMDRVIPDGKKYNGFKVLWTEEPINIPGKKNGTYIGEYYLDKNGDAVMLGRGRFVYTEENPQTGRHTIYDGYWTDNKKDGAIDFEYKNGDHGYVEFREDSLVKPDDWHFAPTYNYADGRVYEGELILKNGIAVPLDYNEVPPRTVFNFAPGPRDFLDAKGDYIVLDKRAAERGFRMSDPLNMREVVPKTPMNSPRQEPIVLRRGPGLKGRFSGIRDSRLSSVGDGPKDKNKELEYVTKITSMQTGLKPLPSLERKSVLPSITRKGGKYRLHYNNTKKNRTK